MTLPALEIFTGDWPPYEARVYQAFLETFVKADIRFQGWRVSAQYRPETRGMHFSFWHTISEAPDKQNRNEDDRIPNLRRCERIRWIGWVISQAGNNGFKWWENERSGNTHVVIWAEEHDFAVVLAKRKDYYVLKTAYAEIKSHRRATFEREWTEFCKRQKG